MKALQYRNIGALPEVVEIAIPEPDPGQIRLKVTAAGVCHSDEFIMGLPEEVYRASYPLPMTLGHEGAGVVDKLGEGATGFQLGDPQPDISYEHCTARPGLAFPIPGECGNSS